MHGINKNMEVHYNIHNIVKISIKTKRPEIIEEYDYYLRFFKSSKIEDADIEIKDFEEFSLPANALSFSDIIFGFDSGICSKKNSYALEIKNGKMILYIKNNDLCINTLIEYFLLQNNCTFLHGAGISYKNKGIIFPAPPNTGKTLLVSKLRKNKEVKFFGDDYLILRNDGAVYSYPMDFSIYDYHFNFFPELKNSPEQLKIKKAVFEKVFVNMVKDLSIRKTFKKIARFFHYDFLKGGEYLKIPAARLIPKDTFGGAAELKYAIFLNRYHGSDFKVEKITPESAAREIIGILQSEWQATMPVYHALSSFGIIDFAKHLNDIKDVAISTFEKIELYRALMPINMNNEARMERLEEFLEKTIFSKI